MKKITYIWRFNCKTQQMDHASLARFYNLSLCGNPLHFLVTSVVLHLMSPFTENSMQRKTSFKKPTVVFCRAEVFYSWWRTWNAVSSLLLLWCTRAASQRAPKDPMRRGGEGICWCRWCSAASFTRPLATFSCRQTDLRCCHFPRDLTRAEVATNYQMSSYSITYSYTSWQRLMQPVPDRWAEEIDLWPLCSLNVHSFGAQWCLAPSALHPSSFDFTVIHFYFLLYVKLLKSNV